MMREIDDAMNWPLGTTALLMVAGAIVGGLIGWLTAPWGWYARG
jgi:hypothetical protein